MIKQIPGHPGYTIEIGDVVTCTCGNKVLENKIYHNSIYWLVDRKKLKAEMLIEETFPGIKDEEYIYQLYKDAQNTPCTQVRKVMISNNITLEQLYIPESYCVTSQQSINLKKEIKEMFPGPLIEVEEGDCTAPRREIYFTTREHLKIVELKLKDLLTFSKN